MGALFSQLDHTTFFIFSHYNISVRSRGPIYYFCKEKERGTRSNVSRYCCKDILVKKTSLPGSTDMQKTDSSQFLKLTFFNEIILYLFYDIPFSNRITGAADSRARDRLNLFNIDDVGIA